MKEGAESPGLEAGGPGGSSLSSHISKTDVSWEKFSVSSKFNHCLQNSSS